MPPYRSSSKTGAFVRARPADGVIAAWACAAERTAVDLVLHTLGCPIEHVEDVAAAFGILTQQEHLSWVDALTVVQARGRDLWTFDKRQKAAHKKA